MLVLMILTLLVVRLIMYVKRQGEGVQHHFFKTQKITVKKHFFCFLDKSYWNRKSHKEIWYRCSGTNLESPRLMRRFRKVRDPQKYAPIAPILLTLSNLHHHYLLIVQILFYVLYLFIRNIKIILNNVKICFFLRKVLKILFTGAV